MKVKDILTDESKWCKGYLGMTASGMGCSGSHPKAVSFCLLGAIYKAYWNDPDDYIADKVRDHLGVTGVATWNNAPERTFAEVRQLIEELDI